VPSRLGGYELWDGLADWQLAGTTTATVWTPGPPSDTALVDGVSLGVSVGVTVGVGSVGVSVGVSVGLGLSVGELVGAAWARGELEQLAVGDGLADPLTPPLGMTPVGALCPFRLGPWPPPELPGPLLAGLPLGKSSSEMVSRTWTRP
jgi:hypothetical protein